MTEERCPNCGKKSPVSGFRRDNDNITSTYMCRDCGVFDGADKEE